MDLIDKKLSEKLKLFEYIDKKYGTNNMDYSTSEKTNSKMNSELNRNFLPLNAYKEKEKTKSISKIDLLNDNSNIYSDYKTNSYKKYFYSPSMNSLDSNKTKYNEKFHKKYQKRNYKKNNNNLSNLTADSSDINRKKNYKNLHPPNDSGDRLYNYGYYIKNKLDKKRKKEEEKIKRQMTPKILNRSREMIKDKYREYRDPNKFEERLYYAEKNDTNDNIYNRRRTLSRENILYEKDKNNKFTHHPKLNKKSLLIASKLEPATLRITRKKEINTAKIVEDNSNSVLECYKNLFKDGNKTFNYMNNFRKRMSNISPFCGNEKSNELYNKGMIYIKNKEKNYKENLLKKEQEYKNYSFHPQIIKNSQKKGKKISDDIYTKNKEWQKRLENENNFKRKKFNEIENKKYTFKPQINKNNMQNDVQFIMKNIQQMNDYVNKRRKVLKQKKEEENYKKKKFGNNANNYNIKTTIIKEFNLKTELRSKSNKKQRDLNIINKNLKMKNDFFNEALIVADNKINNKNNEEECKNNNYNNYNFSGNNYNRGRKVVTSIPSMTQSQQDFLNAVNELHNTMDKLNI